jgi:5-hydroxyisourate hydrolase-like protein (transthyretin family)/thiol-disulfide isomerase/thioredoxin
MKYLKSICIWFLLAALLLPVALHAAEQQQIIQGTVVDEQDQPAADVKVIITGKAPDQAVIETRTDAQGRFTFQTSQPNLRGQKIEALTDSEEKYARSFIRRRNLDPDHERYEMRLQLQPARRVELHVVDGTEQPVPDARTVIMERFRIWGDRKTGENGQVVYHVPQTANIQYVFAMKDGQGADYKAYVKPRDLAGDKQARAPGLPAQPIPLILDGARPVKVQIHDTHGSPLAGVQVYPWILTKADQPQKLNLSPLVHLVRQTTDETGTVEFAWIPRWQKSGFTFWPQAQDYVHQRGSYDPQTGDGTLQMTLEQLVPLSGKVTLPDGSPASQISISAAGQGEQVDSFRSTVQTDESGRYTIKAAPHQVLIVVVKDRKWASTPHTGFLLKPGQPVENLDFQLRPATRIFGQVAVGSQHEPVKGQRIEIYQYGTSISDSQGKQAADPAITINRVTPIMVHSTSTDENGNYELIVGDGKFDIRGPAQSDTRKFEIQGEREREFNFLPDRPEKGILTGTVVTGDPPQPVPDAKITGIYRADRAGANLRCQADQAGRFKVERKLHRTVLAARSQDQKLAGVLEIGPEDKTATIPLQAVGSARGQLIDAATDKPAPEREIHYGVKVHWGDDPHSAFALEFGGTTFSDQQGHFVLPNLVTGQQYAVYLIHRAPDDSGRATWRNIETFTPASIQPVKLGRVEALPPREPYTPPTIEDRIAAAYKLKGTPVERFSHAEKTARLTNQHLLLVFDDRKSDLVRQFMSLYYNDKDIRDLMPCFKLLGCDAENCEFMTEKAREIERHLGVEPDEPAPSAIKGPAVVILKNMSDAVAGVSFDDLSTDGKVSKEKLLKFLKDHQYPTLDARELLDTALKQAKAQNKRVIVQETATWCGPCRLLSLYLDRERKIWERDYIWIKLDHRWTGTRQIMAQLREGAPGGIPWWAILDADGNVLVTSNNDKDQGKNIGFPSRYSDREHVRRMFKQTAIRLSDTEINELAQGLKQKED